MKDMDSILQCIIIVIIFFGGFIVGRKDGYYKKQQEILDSLDEARNFTNEIRSYEIQVAWLDALIFIIKRV